MATEWSDQFPDDYTLGSIKALKRKAKNLATLLVTKGILTQAEVDAL